MQHYHSTGKTNLFKRFVNLFGHLVRNVLLNVLLRNIPWLKKSYYKLPGQNYLTYQHVFSRPGVVTSTTPTTKVVTRMNFSPTINFTLQKSPAVHIQNFFTLCSIYLYEIIEFDRYPTRADIPQGVLNSVN